MSKSSLLLKKRTGAAIAALALSGLMPSVMAQESANAGLENCTQKEQTKSALKGAALGAFAGFVKTAVSDDRNKSDSLGKNMAIGAVAGGGIGFASAYFTAVDKCFKKNPAWLPESKIQRSADYEQVKSAEGYQPAMGVMAKTVAVNAPPHAKPGGKLDLSTRFVALTPDGSEADVTIERRLFAVAEGKETELPFPGQSREQRKVEAGESTDGMSIPIPANIPAGTVFRYEFTVAAAGKTASSASGRTTIN